MLAYLFVLMGIAVHSMGGTFGFTPLGASLLFFGARMPRKQFVAPLAAMVAADIYLTTRVFGLALTWDQGVVWAWYIGALFLGSLLKDRMRVLLIAGAALGTSISFFLASNFAVWLFQNMYPKTWAGLISSYAAGLPFFEKGAVSDLMFSAVFFGTPVLAAGLSRAMMRKGALNLKF